MPVALIIGASRGIGLALAQQYKAAGWRVIATARQPQDLARLAAIGCEPLLLDVTDLNDCAGLGWRLDDEKIDVAILNAGVYGPRTQELSAPGQSEFDQVMHTNVLAAMRLLPLLLPLLATTGGKLAVISSRMGSLSLRDASYGSLYRASKAALNSVLLDIALSTDQVVCLALHPGWVQTDMGGANAAIDVQQSAAGIRATLAAAGPAQHGQFLNYDGASLSW